MKKHLLTYLIFLNIFLANAQVKQYFPAGFRKASVPEWMKTINGKNANINSSVDQQVPFRNNQIPGTKSLPIVAGEYNIGFTFYDMQTNNSISNQLCVNDDGTISSAWTYSPDAISTTNPPFPHRDHGYSFYDGFNFNLSGPNSPSRVGFSNIVVTPISELLVAHSDTDTVNNQIAISYRANRGSGPWTVTYPWGLAFDSWPKACAAGSSGGNNNVYIIFNGSGVFDTTVSHIVAGQLGPIYFSKSIDGGLNWFPKSIIHDIDSSFYRGFGPDNYCIDAKDNIVVIGFGNIHTDVGFLKSIDDGQTWTKTIIQQHPIPMYDGTSRTDIDGDGITDTIFTNTGDIKLLIDNNGMVHAWFSAMRFYSDSINGANTLPWTDGLEYWNESMGTNNYVEIAASQDFNGNGILDYPVDTFLNCTMKTPWGIYNGGMTIMPSAGIDANGNIYLAYHALTENPNADTIFYHALHRHVYVMSLSPPYDPANWSYPFDIIPSSAVGGSGEEQEGAFACMGRTVEPDFAYVLYQRDEAPGHSIMPDGTCDRLKNAGNPSDIILTVLDKVAVGISSFNTDNLFVSQNYPNPVSGVTFININLKKSANVLFEVYDVVGKKVYSEIKKSFQEGHHSISFNASELEAGIYNYTVSAVGQRTCRRMIVQR